MGNTWMVGIHKMPVAVFNGLQPPVPYILKNTNAPAYPFVYTFSHSNICDSATGDILFSCNAMRMYDTTGNIMQNGAPYNL
jgi:hypothetical protein